MKHCLLILFFLVLGKQVLFCQEWLGIINSNYGGNVSLQLNPASVVGSPYTQEINLIAADFSLHNNYIYYPAQSSALGKIIKGKVSQKNTLDLYTNSPNKQAYYNLFLKGPGVMFSNNASGFAVNIGYRQILSARNVNTHIAKFMLEGFDYQPQHNINYKTQPYKLNFVSLYDFAFTYGRGIVGNERHTLSAGITMSVYAGNSAFFIDNKNMDYIVPVSQLLIVNNTNIRYGYAFTGEKPGAKDFMKVRGWGLGSNVGMTYIDNRNDKAYKKTSQPRKKYNFKIGVSIIDMGFINFKKQTKQFSFENASTFWPGIDTTKFSYMNYNDSLLNNKFTGSSEGGLVSKKFAMHMPAAFSLQVDFAVSPEVYINFSAIQHFQIAELQVQRNDQLSITPRYEKQNWEVALPYSFYNYYQHRIGLAWRYRWFFIGTDRLGPLTGLWDLNGIDFYFGVKLISQKQRKVNARSTDCFMFNKF